MTAAAVLAALAAGGPVPGRHVVVIAHPDDEAISFGGALCVLEDVLLIQLTDGAHLEGDGPDARAATVAQRRTEREAAHEAAGWHLQILDVGVPMRETLRHLPRIAALIADVVRDADADVVWTHPYENGHIDHDSAAWVCAALPVLRLEFASYYMGADGRSAFGTFWPDPTHPAVCQTLSAAYLVRKQTACAAYASQAHILRKFPSLAREWYREAPVYDFSCAASVPRSRWDVKGYAPSTAAWRAATRVASEVAA